MGAGLPEWVVFKDLSFTCSGTVTSLWFLAAESNRGGASSYPEFQLWRGGRFDNKLLGEPWWYRGREYESRRASHASAIAKITNGSSVSLYQYTLSEPLEFREGDVFGMRHAADSSLVVQYQNGGGIPNFFRSVNSSTFQYANLRYPLISLGGKDTRAHTHNCFHRTFKIINPQRLCSSKFGRIKKLCSCVKSCVCTMINTDTS